MQEVRYGSRLHEVQYHGKRPDKVIIAVGEIKGHVFTKQFMHYVKADLMPSLTLEKDVTICLVCDESPKEVNWEEHNTVISSETTTATYYSPANKVLHQADL